eukprot:TRINITY_DN20057_c0_g1_i1.p1 TRINITY_DN20057_c0_g1~~TRINITY_DN20057_c0_g1_i1.p1  ORF type:complete len:432 (-),score=88.16 TRINITY_DN20057_c0_g1_i1:112-1374(-)
MSFVTGNIKRGSHVILRDSEGSQKVFFLAENCIDLRMGKYGPIPAEAVLNVPYGANLRRSLDGNWERVRRSVDSGVDDDKAEVQETNRFLAQDNSAQSLTPQEVKEMKGSCTGEEIVEALASNSSTFAGKTKFAQEKYLKKKAQKHVQQVAILRPTVMDLCETYLKHFRMKVCGLRFDYLSSILCHADVRTGGRYFLLDCAAGIVAGAMAKQLAGSGRIFRVFRTGCPDKGLTELDLSEAEIGSVRQISIDALQSEDPFSHEWLQAPVEGLDPNQTRQEARKTRHERRKVDFEDLQDQPVDAVVIVAGDDDAELAADAVEIGLQRLVSGGRAVVFGHHLQPLAALQGTWRTSGSFVDVRLEQLFTREYQVLPLRTHPHMSAEAELCGGYILSASKVVGDCPSVSDAAEDQSRKGKRRKTR